MEQEYASQQVQQPVVIQQDEDSGLQITDLLAIFFHNWKWFAVSCLLCLFVAFIHIRRSTPVYTRSAQILIKEDGTKGSFSGNVDWFASLGMGTSAVTVQNELVAVQSPATFVEVVERLGLTTTYQKDGRWHDTSLYGRTLPVILDFKDMGPDDTGSLDMELRKDGSVLLSNFVSKGQKTDSKLKAHIGQTVKTPLGRLRIGAGPAAVALTDMSSDMLSHVQRTSVLSASKRAAAGLSASLNSKENSIIDLNYRDTNTQRAEDILNTLIEAYNDAWVKDKNQMTEATNEFIMERLSVIQGELDNVDDEISSYKSANLVTDPTMVAGLYINDANDAGKKAMDLGNQLYMAQYIRSFISSDEHKNELLPVNIGLGNSGMEQQFVQYNQLLLERNRLLGSTGNGSDLIRERDKALEQQRQSIITGIDNQINMFNAQLRSVRQSERKATSGIANSPEQTRFLGKVSRQLKVKEALYIFLLQKREENELSLAFTAYNTRIITPPMGSNAPVSPQSNRILLIALLIGLVVPAVIMYLIEQTDTRVRGRKDIEKLCVPFVGEIPLVGRSKRNPLQSWLEKFGIIQKKEIKETERKITVKARSRNIINEAFRVVRTNLDFMGLETEGGKLIMITSLNPGSGKTYISGNLAATFSLKGKKVLLLDFDMRRASASLYVGKQKKGISAYLSGKTNDWHELVVPMPEVEGMDVLPVGTLPPNPAELLTIQRTEQLLKELREAYDIVFIDCPPVEIVADATIIAKYVDQTIFVVRVGLMEREMLPVVEGYYKQDKFKSMSLLLNGSVSSHSRYGYSYGRGYGYGYGYGYGNSYYHEDK